MKEKQEKMEGILKTIKEVEDAAEALRSIRTRRMEIQKQEEEAVKVLKGAMEKHKLDVYSYDAEDGEGEPIRLDAMVKTTEKVYVRKHKDPEEEAEEEEAETQD